MRDLVLVFDAVLHVILLFMSHPNPTIIEDSAVNIVILLVSIRCSYFTLGVYNIHSIFQSIKQVVKELIETK